MSESLTSAEVAHLTGRLREAEQELRVQLGHEADASAPVRLDQQAVGRVSRIDAIQQQQMARASHAQANELLRQTLAALRRIEADEYGECLRCAQPIGFARLDAQPHAQYCIGCQSALEER